MAGSFIDTNILIYLASADEGKANAAEEVVRKGGTISVQVLNEFAHVARRKLNFSWDELAMLLGAMRGLFDVVPLAVAIHDRGLHLAERHQLSTYDAMILAAALESGCDTLYSEDFQNGMSVAGLTVINPLKLTD
jgi:predicted nucleic acid-binding protein